MALVKIGTMALRSPKGEFLPEEPIYREIEEPKNNGEYIPLGELAEIFADKFKAHKVAQKKVRKSSLYNKRCYEQQEKQITEAT